MILFLSLMAFLIGVLGASLGPARHVACQPYDALCRRAAVRAIDFEDETVLIRLATTAASFNPCGKVPVQTPHGIVMLQQGTLLVVSNEGSTTETTVRR